MDIPSGSSHPARCRIPPSQSGIDPPSNSTVVVACAVNHDLELKHCDSHFEKILPVASKL